MLALFEQDHSCGKMSCPIISVTFCSFSQRSEPHALLDFTQLQVTVCKMDRLPARSPKDIS